MSPDFAPSRQAAEHAKAAFQEWHTDT